MSIDKMFWKLRHSMIGLGLVAALAGCGGDDSTLCPKGTTVVEEENILYCKSSHSKEQEKKLAVNLSDLQEKVESGETYAHNVSCPEGSMKEPKRYLDGSYLYFCIKDNHVRHGPIIELYKDKKIKLSGNYKDNEMDDMWTKWYSNGEIAENGIYSNGNKEGVWTAWDENGAKIREEEFYKNKPEGKLTTWYNKGGLHEQGQCEEGYKIGEWTIIAENGTVTHQSYQRGHSRSSEKCYLWDDGTF